MAEPDSPSEDRRATAAESILYVTCATVNDARVLGRLLVGERLVACANILADMRSIYWWQGEIVEDDEAVLLLKTARARVPAVIARVCEVHSYAVPCVVELPLARGNPAYLDWIAGETSGRPDRGR